MEVSHPYAQVNVKRDPNELCYDLVDIKWGDIKNYVIHKKLGRGRYSQVFQGTDKRNGKKVAIKVLAPIQKDKIRREYHITQSLNHPNIVKLKDIVKCDHLKTTSFVMELFQNVNFRDVYLNLNLNDIKLYMRQLLTALDYIHSKGIMHRDIKPLNILINPDLKVIKIIDFGLSEYYIPGKDNSEHVGSLYYRAPELIFGNLSYDYRVDCWSAGLILAGMIFKKTPFLYGTSDVDQILKVTRVIGTKQTIQYIKENKLVERKGHSKQNLCFDLIIAYQKEEILVEKKSNFEEYQNEQNKQNCTWEAIDLIKKLVVLDYKKRMTAKEALNHPFFD